MTEGSDLYHKTLAHDYGDPRRQELMRKVWEPTPWMLDAYTDSWPSSRCAEIREWCRNEFGPESSPLHDIKGNWHFGGATIHGWTWIGFATEEQMNRFAECWPESEPEQ